ncbi:MAG TPA: hypothetical protein VIG06_03145 [Kofleriaceae bacterium]
MRAAVAVTVALLLSFAVPLGAEAGRASRPGGWRRAVAARIHNLRREPRSQPGLFGRARAATARRVKRVTTRVRQGAARRIDRVARGAVFAGIAVTWLGASQADPAHQMTYVVGGIAIAAVSAGIIWVRMIKGLRREEAAFAEEFHARFDSMFDDFESFAGGGGSWQPPRPRPPVPRPPPGETWPADLVAALEEMAGASDKDQLGKIYRRAAKRYHPDIGGDPEHSKTLNAFHTALEDAMP